VILMNTGRILTGFASRNAGGWIVEQPNGRVQVPLDQVNVVANSLVDAYRKQRDSVVKPTPATHMALAQWCISYRLHHEARDELKKCLTLDPDHTSARKLLRRLDDMLDPVEPRKLPAAPNRTSDGFLVPDAESLGGLSTDAATTFTQRIQPLLINKCGNASCHGTTSSKVKVEGFHLIPVRPGTTAHRLYTERNLAEVLRYIDLQEPGLSPLVAIPQGTHAGTAGVFHGTAGNGQIKMLRAWILAVAREKQAEEDELSLRPSIAAKSTRQTPASSSVDDSLNSEMDLPEAAVLTASGTDAPVRAAMKFNPGQVPGSNVGNSPAELTTDQRDAQPVSPGKGTASRSERTTDDPFDPDIFNRRFHSPPRR
jgi:hypothetical protein